jgi:hypothetical protein
MPLKSIKRLLKTTPSMTTTLMGLETTKSRLATMNGTLMLGTNRKNPRRE